MTVVCISTSFQDISESKSKVVSAPSESDALTRSCEKGARFIVDP